MWTLPNIMTMGRLVLLPLIIACLFVEWAWIALALYIIAALSDFFDCWLARKLQQTSEFGTFLDPIADKIFIAALLVVFVGTGRLDGLWMIPAIVILAREFLIAGLREYLGPKNIQIPVSPLAKWKTTVQMIAVGILIVGPHVPYMLAAGQWSLAAAAVLTVITGWGYVKKVIGNG